MMASSRILVVEDEIVLAKTLTRALRNMGYEVVGRVNNGEAAVEKAKETDPDLVMMDIMLDGEMDGIEAATRIRAFHDTAIIYLTAHTARDVFDRAKDTEPQAYITKPISPQELGRTVEMALYKHEADKRVRASEERFRTSLSHAPIGMAIINTEGRILEANNSFQEMLGYTEDELTAMVVSDFTHPEDVEDSTTLIRNLLKGESEHLRIEKRYCRKNGSTVWAHTAVSAVRDAQGEVPTFHRYDSGYYRPQAG
jgi:PAS domain S-box-containing protein